jgi:3-hydroxybutyryl-CoA dehydratase
MDFQLGLSYDQLDVGQRASFSKTPSGANVYIYAGVIGDCNPVDVNEEFATPPPFGRRIAHRGLPQSLIASAPCIKLPGLGTVAVEITAKFKAPPFFGDTVASTAEVV